MTWTDPEAGKVLFQTSDVLTEGNISAYLLDNLLATMHPYDYSMGDVDVNTTTTETSLWSKVITGTHLGANGMAYLRIEGDYLYNNSTADTIRLRVKFGGASVIDFGTVVPSNVTSASRWPWEMDVRLYNEAATNAQLIAARVYGRGKSTSAISTGIGYIGFTDAAASGALHGMGQNTAAVNTASDQTLQVTAQWSASSANDSWRKRGAVLLLGRN